MRREIFHYFNNLLFFYLHFHRSYNVHTYAFLFHPHLTQKWQIVSYTHLKQKAECINNISLKKYVCTDNYITLILWSRIFTYVHYFLKFWKNVCILLLCLGIIMKILVCAVHVGVFPSSITGARPTGRRALSVVKPSWEATETTVPTSGWEDRN